MRIPCSKAVFVIGISSIIVADMFSIISIHAIAFFYFIYVFSSINCFNV